MREDLTKYSLVAILLLLLYFSYLVVQPFLTYLFFSIILVLVFYPVYKWLVKKTNRPRTSSLFLVIALSLLLIVPSFFLGVSLVRQAPAFYETAVQTIDLSLFEQLSEQRFGVDLDAEQELEESVPRFRSYVLNNVGAFLSGATALFIGLFIMFFTMYYLFAQGENVLREIQKILPLSKKHQKKLLKNIHDVIHAIINGQLILGAIQGVVTGVLLLILGVPYAVLWGFATIVTSIIPVLGSFAIWVPISIWLAIQGQLLSAIFLASFGLIVISQLDNVLRPYVVSRQADIHPAVVIVGVFGGLIAFGAAGFVTGPVVLALLITVLKFYSEEVAVV